MVTVNTLYSPADKLRVQFVELCNLITTSYEQVPTVVKIPSTLSVTDREVVIGEIPAFLDCGRGGCRKWFE